MLLIQLMILLLMLVGLIGTLLPKVPGTLIIVSGIVFYGFVVHFSGFTGPFWLIVIVLTMGAEIGARFLRYYLTKNARFSRQFTSEVTGGSLAALLVSDILLGPVAGSLLWEVFIGQSVVPRFRVLSGILLRLAGVALLRFVIGIMLMGMTIWFVM